MPSLFVMRPLRYVGFLLSMTWMVAGDEPYLRGLTLSNYITLFPAVDAVEVALPSLLGSLCYQKLK